MKTEKNIIKNERVRQIKINVRSAASFCIIVKAE